MFLKGLLQKFPEIKIQAAFSGSKIVEDINFNIRQPLFSAEEFVTQLQLHPYFEMYRSRIFPSMLYLFKEMKLGAFLVHE